MFQPDSIVPFDLEHAARAATFVHWRDLRGPLMLPGEGKGRSLAPALQTI